MNELLLIEIYSPEEEKLLYFLPVPTLAALTMNVIIGYCLVFIHLIQGPQ